MTDSDRQAYRSAYSARETVAERSREIIDHCRWIDGRLDVMTIPKAGAEPPVDLQGSLL